MDKPPVTLIRLPQVVQRVGVSRRTLYRLMESDGFPQPTLIRGCACWSQFDVESWISRRLSSESRSRRTPVRAIEITAHAYDRLLQLVRDGETPDDAINRLVLEASAPGTAPTRASSRCAL